MKRILCVLAVWTICLSAILGQEPSRPGRPIITNASDADPHADPSGPVMTGPVTFPKLQATPELIEVTPTEHAPQPDPLSWDWNPDAARCYRSEANKDSVNHFHPSSFCRDANCRSCCRHNMPPSGPIKSCLQESHWGYCNYFHERPFGASVESTLALQIHRGSEHSLTLYHFDFYPADSNRAAELTPRGISQLLKLLARMHFASAPLRVQMTDANPELDEERRIQVIGALAELGVDTPDRRVVLAPVRHQRDAIEAAQTYENWLQSVIFRGRTLQAAESASFGGQ